VTVLTTLGLSSPSIVDGQVFAELGDRDSAEVTNALVGAGIPVRQLIVERPDLEELFVGLTGEGFDVDQ
jgi:ABC-2 type transport system ATP-binding protein